MSCENEFQNRGNFLKIYLHDMVERSLSKPLRVYKEVEYWPASRKKRFSSYRPFVGRLFGKPRKEFRNLYQTLKK